MKFLIFNLIVGIALIYLFNGEGVNFQAVPEKAQAATEIIKSKITAITGAPEKPIEKTAPKDPAPTPAGSAVITLNDAKLGDGSALKLAKTEPFKLDPAIFKRRKEIMETSMPSSSEATAPGNGLMSRQDRQEALMKLAEDMEFFSAEAISR